MVSEVEVRFLVNFEVVFKFQIEFRTRHSTEQQYARKPLQESVDLKSILSVRTMALARIDESTGTEEDPLAAQSLLSMNLRCKQYQRRLPDER